MEATISNEELNITFCKEEALVLLEWLTNFNNGEHPNLFQDQAEQRVLWNLECVLEKNISETFLENYRDLLSKAREKVRDEEFN